jgi:hypothetical protein
VISREESCETVYNNCDYLFRGNLHIPHSQAHVGLGGGSSSHGHTDVDKRDRSGFFRPVGFDALAGKQIAILEFFPDYD